MIEEFEREQSQLAKNRAEQRRVNKVNFPFLSKPYKSLIYFIILGSL